MSFATLDSFLAVPHHPDAWDDDGVDHARALIAKLDSDGWETLTTVWGSRPPQWQAQLASALFAQPDPRAGALLSLILRDGTSEGATAAAEALGASDDWWTPTRADFEALERLAKTAHPTFAAWLLRVAARAR